MTDQLNGAQSHPALLLYVDLLRKWNATINLVAAGDMPDVWRRHVEDSLQLGTIAGPLPPRGIDLGSGAGFPGLILSIAFGIEFELIEQDQRKAAFLREAIRVTGAKSHIHATKIERAALSPAPLVTSRALAPLSMLLAYACPLLTETGFCLFPKTRAAEPEIAEAERHWSFQLESLPSRTDANGMILRISELRPLG